MNINALSYDTTPSYPLQPKSNQIADAFRNMSFPGATTGENSSSTDPSLNYRDNIGAKDGNESSKDPFADLDYLVTQIIRCDDQYCEGLSDMFMDTILVAIHVKYPEMQRDIEQCIDEHGLEAKPCTAMFMEAINRVNPMVYDLIEQKRRLISPDPLINYDGLQYISPFWFTGAGDIWRRIDGRSKRVNITNCNIVQKNLDECLALPQNKRNNGCFIEYSHAKMCAPGVHCPYLRLPMTQCMYNEAINDYRDLDYCFSTISKFDKCKDGFVPLDAGF
jgi:hypothetical protein